MLPKDYVERVYAGVLGKIIGVYLGRPFEQWPHDRIVAQLGEINYYVNDRLNVPLVVFDDDISGTFTFIRALEDHGSGRSISAAQIGQTWLNYIIEKKAILWWGGMGISTEHTAYLRLKSGIAAPASGSIALNGKTVAEEIGSQIFIDGWAMVAPGDPALAVELARKAASVSHDGEGIYGAQVIAAMESMAFVEPDLNRLLDVAVSFIPTDSATFRLIDDMRNLRSREPDWHKALAHIHEHYSYQKIGGLCPIVSNDAIILLGLLWGDDDFQKSLMITNTAGYDTDCNSGNVGCLLGIKNGLAAIDAGPDWRGPVADRMLLATADGGSCITNAASQAYRLANMGRVLAGESPVSPKHGARFHFELPGSVQGFQIDAWAGDASTAGLENVAGHSASGSRCLAIRGRFEAGRSVRVSTPTFLSVDQIKPTTYAALACPTLYPGDSITAGVSVDTGNAAALEARLFIRHYDHLDQLQQVSGPAFTLHAGQSSVVQWTVPAVDGQPVADVGLELTADTSGVSTAYLDFLTWDSTPDVVLKKPKLGGTMWLNAWVDGTDQGRPVWSADMWSQNVGRGLLIQGTRSWRDYTVTAQITPHVAKTFGIAARVQGMTRYYGLILSDRNRVSLVRVVDTQLTLAERPFAWEFGTTYQLTLSVIGQRLQAFVDDRLLFEHDDNAFTSLAGGGIAIICEVGRIRLGPVSITST